MTFPSLCIHLGEVVGYALERDGRFGVGFRDFHDRADPRPGLSLPRLGAWLGDVRRELSSFSMVAAVDLDFKGVVPLLRRIEEWAMLVAGPLRVVTPAEVKRAAIGPYATRREILGWARDKYPQLVINHYEQAAALAGLVHLGSGAKNRSPY
jgi:hypothetical protein